MKKDIESSFFRYLSSAEDKTPCMFCTTVGSNKVKPGAAYPDPIWRYYHPAPFRPVVSGRVLSEFQLLYITEGEGIFTSDKTVYQVTPGSVLLLLPGVKHAYHPLPETGWHEYWVGFKGAYFLELIETGYFSREKVFFNIGLHDSILSLYNKIFDEVLYQRPLYQMRVCTSILALITEVLDRERCKDIPEFYHQIVEKAKLLMEANIFSTINLPDIANQLSISTSHFHKIFKTYTSMTPYQYFILIKMQKAENLLSRGGISVKEAASRLGFENQYHFSNLFKNKIGISPLNWMKYIKGTQKT